MIPIGMLPASHGILRSAALSATAGIAEESKVTIVRNQFVDGKILGATMPPNAGLVMRTALLGNNGGEAPSVPFTLVRALV